MFARGWLVGLVMFLFLLGISAASAVHLPENPGEGAEDPEADAQPGAQSDAQPGDPAPVDDPIIDDAVPDGLDPQPVEQVSDVTERIGSTWFPFHPIESGSTAADGVVLTAESHLQSFEAADPADHVPVSWQDEPDDEEDASTGSNGDAEPDSANADAEPSSDASDADVEEGDTDADEGDEEERLLHLLGELPLAPLPEYMDGILHWVPDVSNITPQVLQPTPGAPETVAPGGDAIGPAPAAFSVSESRATERSVIAVAAFAAVGVALVAASGTGAFSSTAGVFTRFIGAARVGLAALYARLAGERVLEHGKRNEILEFLRAQPGACLTEIQEAVEAGLTTVRYHLQVLQRNGLVADVKSGRRRCYFARGDGVPLNARAAAAALSSTSMRRVFDAISNRPGIRQQELAAALRVTPTSVIFHAKRLEDAGVVRRARCGREMAYYPSAPGATPAPATGVEAPTGS